MLLQIFGQHRQQARRRLNELYAYVVEVKQVEFFFLNRDKLGKCARLLDARGAAADYHERHALFAVFGRAVGLFGALELVNDVIANVNRLLQSFHAERMFLDAFHPEKVSRRARRKNQIIVVDFAVIG